MVKSGIALFFLQHRLLVGVGGQHHTTLYPRQLTRCPILCEPVWAPGPGWTGAENLAPPPGFDPPKFQPVASRHTNYTVTARSCKKKTPFVKQCKILL
jgi:hypothetical protein